MLAQRYILKGRVQGVGFRFFTSEAARRLGVRGWVRNLSNGDLEVHAQAAEAALREFRKALEAGPSWAVVERVEVSEVEPADYSRFSIER